MKCVCTVIAAFALAGLAFGQNGRLETAKELQATCSTAMKVYDKAADANASIQDATDYGKCIGYVEGVLDSLKDLKHAGQQGETYTFHLHGDQLSVKDAVVVFLNFMDTDNKHDRDGAAAPIVVESLMRKHIVTLTLVTR